MSDLLCKKCGCFAAILIMGLSSVYWPIFNFFECEVLCDLIAPELWVVVGRQ